MLSHLTTGVLVFDASVACDGILMLQCSFRGWGTAGGFAVYVSVEITMNDNDTNNNVQRGT